MEECFRRTYILDLTLPTSNQLYLFGFKCFTFKMINFSERGVINKIR